MYGIKVFFLFPGSGAHSTDLEAPESAEHLCDKCHAYAACWKPRAEKLWDEEHGAESV